MKDAFSSYHPLVNFIYFLAVLLFSMFFMHPVCLVLSVICATVYAVYLKGKAMFGFAVKFMLPVVILAALINVLFNHQGVTILGYLPGGNPFTLESVIYSLGASFMLVSVIQWFTCYNRVMTTDKFVYLFGRIIPALSLVLSMTLRFVPKFNIRFKMTQSAQRCIGRDTKSGPRIHRLKNGIKIFSVMITWSLENSIETADSMKSRGYGLTGRTAFSIYRFEKRDALTLVIYVLLCAYIITGKALGYMEWSYYPRISEIGLSAYDISLYIAYAVLCLLPMVINIREDVKWKRLQSEI